ncbi:MAG: hypothetical protein D6746_01720 [Bacteroidetes bacterium]|nr:MAG: hypothetical protein D6746_01720 [Bacteroidota bacterium]
MNPNDAPLRDAFRALRAEDHRRAPGFEEVLARPRPPARVIPLASLAAAAAVVLLLAVGLWLWPRPGRDTPDDLFAWQSPTDVLLAWPLEPPPDEAPLPPLDAWEAPTDFLLAPPVDPGAL